MYTASTWRRFLAYFLDQGIASLFFLPIAMQVFSKLISGHEVFISWRWLAACLLAQFLYRISFLYFMGATIGKLAMGLRVVSFKTGDSPSMAQCFLRVTTDSLSLFFSLGLRALALIRFDRRQVADWVAETWVCQKSPQEHPPRPRLVLALALFCYFSITGFYSVYTLMQKSEWDRHGVTVNLFAGIIDRPESGL